MTDDRGDWDSWDQRLAEARARYEEWREDHLTPEWLQKVADSLGPMYLDPEGRPIELAEWSLLLSEREKTADQAESWWRKQTKVTEEIHVSTVWLGLNQSWMPGDPPLFWETMIFGESEWAGELWRYSSRAAAFDDHERIVRALRGRKDPNE